jgi:hypothetical protein
MLYDKLNFNFIRDIAPVAGISRQTYVMVVHPSFPTKTGPEFIAYATANPDTLRWPRLAAGSFSHLASELFRPMTGLNVVHVPYRASILTDLLSGQVHVFFSGVNVALDHVRTGSLRALAVTSAVRSGAARHSYIGRRERLKSRLRTALRFPDLGKRLSKLQAHADGWGDVVGVEIATSQSAIHLRVHQAAVDVEPLEQAVVRADSGHV